MNWENFPLLLAIVLGIAGARRKGRWALWDFLPLVIFTWALRLVCCLPKGCFSQERHEEQRRGRPCSAGGKALIWSASGDHRQDSNMMQNRKKLILVPSGFLLSSDTGPFRAWGTHSVSECPNILSANVSNMQICFTQPSPWGSTCENIGSKESPWKWKCAFHKSSETDVRSTQGLLI